MNEDALYFLTFCVGAVALSLKMTRTEVYARLKAADLVNDYIVPGYDILHTFSRSYIVEDIIDMMKRKGVLQ
ncbi:MAG: DUF3791 domain-containing protein [Prevotellaceae bacterium]|nr:DUF3791 domain-containing protein [Prevotellaceae bacterium]MCD8304212.1 DUF3791 domain-containing protein [Prevotellaceae bacterium]